MLSCCVSASLSYKIGYGSYISYHIKQEYRILQYTYKRNKVRLKDYVFVVFALLIVVKLLEEAGKKSNQQNLKTLCPAVF